MTKKTQKKLRKALLLISCAALLVCITVGVTVAYLTSEATVTNTFTVGKVEITMDETDTTVLGVSEGTRSDDGNAYQLFPGREYVKDPKITVADGSQDCWLFVKVENGIAAIEDESATIASQIAANEWTLVEGKTNIYAYKEIVSAGDVVDVFESFKVASDVIDVLDYEDAEIIVTAYAVQADGFATSGAAWTAAHAELGE